MSERNGICPSWDHPSFSGVIACLYSGGISSHTHTHTLLFLSLFVVKMKMKKIKINKFPSYIYSDDFLDSFIT